MEYKLARPLMSQGDLIAFSGTGVVSALIKAVTLSSISHVGVILKTKVMGSGAIINQIIESTSLGDGFAGVQINRMSQRVEQYKGKIYWYALNDEAGIKFQADKFFNFMLKQNRKPYDKIQAAFSAFDFAPDTPEDFSKMFCSELVTAGYEKSGIIKNINASEQTPADVCNFGIYKAPVEIV